MKDERQVQSMTVIEFGKQNQNTLLLLHGGLRLNKPELYAKILTDQIGEML